MQSKAAMVRIGTRGSPLALAQARMLRARLMQARGWPEAAIALTVIRTSGDMIQDRPLTEAGGKGLFTKEIDAALLAGTIDLAVHSAKDLPTVLPDGLTVAATLPREDPRDVFISRTAKSVADLPTGAVIGTASVRRQAMVLRQRGDLRAVTLRGNVETRLRKLDEGVADATLLALAGLKRLGLADRATAILDADTFVPAAGQGIIAIEARTGDDKTHTMLAPINDDAAMTALAAERAFLGVLDGSCRTPIAGHARIDGNAIAFRGVVLRPDGSESHETTRNGAVADAAALGADAGEELKRRAGAGFFVAD